MVLWKDPGQMPDGPAFFTPLEHYARVLGYSGATKYVGALSRAPHRIQTRGVVGMQRGT